METDANIPGNSGGSVTVGLPWPTLRGMLIDRRNRTDRNANPAFWHRLNILIGQGDSKARGEGGPTLERFAERTMVEIAALKGD